MTKRIFGLVSLAALTLAMAHTPAMAQVQAAPPPAIPAPVDTPYAGALGITVDATDLDHKIFKIHETVPVAKAGDLILLLPKWLPGHHSPGTNIAKVAELVVTANGQRLDWVRDTADVNAFHIDVPRGVTSVTVDFDYLSATTAAAGPTVMTQDMMDLEWNFASLYPAGYYVKRIPVDAKVIFPAGWGYGTGLETANRDGDTVTFKTTDYDTLIDSPIYAGRYFKSFDLDPGSSVPVHLDVVADSPDLLAAPDDVIAIHRNLIQQAYKLYGSHHYNHYDFLVSASDKLTGNGLEHHRSSEDGVPTKYFTDWKNAWLGRDLLAHEYTHSWNGKYRRGADLWTPNFDVPMRDSLLWVYEGQTQYWGIMLAGRSGLYSKDQALQVLAATAASYDNLPGRSWRALQDTTNDPIISSRSPQNWRSEQRSEDYYNEGLLIWLDADTLIRQKTNGTKSLDDFAKAFFGVNNGDWNEDLYTFDDVVKTLNGVYPYDWATFLRTRLDGHGEANDGGAPLDGITRGGYKLAYVDTPSDYQKAAEALRKSTDFTYSLGFAVSAADGSLSSVLWNGPAFKLGLVPGAMLIAVNGKTYTSDGLKAAVTAAKGGKDPIQLLFKVDDTYKTLNFDYHDGLRYPVLQPIDGAPKLLDDILAEKK